MVERGETKKTTKKKTVHPPEKKNFRRSFQVRCRSQGEGEGGGHSPPGLPRGVWSEGAAAICVLV